MKKREEIEEKYKWDLSKYCKNDEDFYCRIKKIENFLDKFKQYENKLSQEDVLFDCLEFQSSFENEFAKLLVYCGLRLSENISSKTANEMNEIAEGVQAKYLNATAFIDVEIAKFSLKKLRTLQKNKMFVNYSRYFEGVIREKKHTLSKKEELLLSNLSQCFGSSSSCFDKFADVDLKFDKISDKNAKLHELNQSNYITFCESDDRVLRENAYAEMNGKFGQFINLLSANYIANVKEDCVLAKIRGYKSALYASIYNEEASESVYKTIIKKTRENVGIFHRYLELKRKMLGLNKLMVFDTLAPITKNAKKYSYADAVELVKKSTALLGEEYASYVKKAVDNRWIDVYPNENKDSGGFSTGVYGANPVVLMNFENNMESVMTLAHELGHAIHSCFADKNQPMQKADYVIFVAEVASRTNELLLLNFMLQNAKNKDERICILNELLTLARVSIFKTTLSAEFEEFAHAEFEKGTPLTAELLCEKHEELTKFYYGDRVQLLPQTKFEWTRLPHFYSSFYVYKYTVGLVCAFNIVGKLLTDKSFVSKYIDFLSSGGSDDPISLLKIAECDLNDEKTYNNAFALCEKYLKMWEEELS